MIIAAISLLVLIAMIYWLKTEKMDSNVISVDQSKSALPVSSIKVKHEQPQPDYFEEEVNALADRLASLHLNID